MIDLETLDTKPSAIVVSIGVVAFDPVTFQATDGLYAILEMGGQLHRGRTRSPDTLAWWEQQSDAAKAVFKQPRQDVSEVLDRLDTMLAGSDGVWGNGADFDCVITGSLYESFQRTKPWSYSKNRCLRTLKSVLLPKQYVKPERLGTHHNAMDDALHQVHQLKVICEATGIRF